MLNDCTEIGSYAAGGGSSSPTSSIRRVENGYLVQLVPGHPRPALQTFRMIGAPREEGPSLDAAKEYEERMDASRPRSYVFSTIEEVGKCITTFFLDGRFPKKS